uniref:Protein krueppel n=1 Tax=Stomoxys calcitrans TaxID=35570 RepID=A0A1I8NTI2_STOCA
MEQLGELEACRICVTCYPIAEMDFIHIFQKNEEFQHELNFIRGEIKQWQLKIELDDGLPQRICADCFAKFCSIEAFRKECEMAQQKLVQTVLQAENKNNVLQSPMLAQTTSTGGGVGGGAMPMMDTATDHQQDLVSAVALVPQNDIVLNDYRVFDQRFDQFDDNPTLMDSSSTLLDNNLTGNGMGFLPSQNLFTFETAEAPSAGTLPLDETEPPSIMGEIMDVQSAAGNGDEHKSNLEDMLKSSIISTNTTSITTTNQTSANMTVVTTRTTTTTPSTVAAAATYAAIIKTEPSVMFKTERSSNKAANDNISDNECDDVNVNKRLKGLPYTCHYCYCPDSGPIDHLSFTDEDALSQHFFDIHDPNRPYICPQCDNSYKTQWLRDNHVRIAHETVKKCNLCQKTLRGSLEIHQFHCQHVGDWECGTCKEKFPNTPHFRFRLHQRNHERNKSFNCRVCERSFTRKANLESHEKMHKNEGKSLWNCDICKTNFLTNYDLRRHNYQQHDDESPVKCKDCNQGFSSIAFLQRHITQIHNSISTNVMPSSNLHICLKCNATFTSLDTLQKHMAIANNNNGQCLSSTSNFDYKERRRIQRQGVFPCFLCPKRFHLRSQLDKHLNTHDARLRPYQCEQCYVRCRTAVELKQHVDVAHLNIKAFSCEKCGKSFGYKKDLRDHMLFHAELNVHCTEEGCDYVCKNEKALNDHIRHKHRLLSCEYCHEEFTRQKLTAHLRNVHRTEIDVELAGESEHFLKSKLLNNNNDITQISFNLLNTQAVANSGNINATAAFESLSSSLSAVASTSSACSSSSISSSPPMTASNNLNLNNSNNNNNNNHSNNMLHMTASVIPVSPTSSSSTLSSNLATVAPTQAATNASNIFITDHNSNNLALNDFVATATTINTTQNDMNLVNGAAAAVGHGVGPHNANVNCIRDTMFVVSSTTTSASTSTSPSTTTTSPSNINENNLDQYFMASLMDTEQEITVT